MLPLLIRKTELNALARQVVHVDLVGLSGEARRQAILKALAPRPLPKPVENVSAPYAYGWSEAGRVRIVAGPTNTPFYRFAGGERDHHDRLDACRKTAARLAADLAAGKHNVRGAYRETLQRFLEELPSAPGAGNFLLADSEARTLRGLFEEDAGAMPREVGERINRVLEFAIALRPFYEGVSSFYAAVNSGEQAPSLPRNAVEGFVEAVREYTPEAFEAEVAQGLDKVDDAFAPPPEDGPPLAPEESDGATLKPRPDPIEAPDPAKAHDYGMASSINAIYSTFLKGKDLASAVKGWDEIAQKLGEHAGQVIEFLQNFRPGG